MANLVGKHLDSHLMDILNVRVNDFRAISNVVKHDIEIDNNLLDINYKIGSRLITDQACEFFIYDVPIDKILKVFNSDSTLKCKYVYIGDRILCKHCLGCGKVDWITHANGVPKKREGSISFNRNRHKKLRRTTDGFFVATAKKRADEFLCNYCGGTGLAMFNNDSIGKEARKLR